MFADGGGFGAYAGRPKRERFADRLLVIDARDNEDRQLRMAVAQSEKAGKSHGIRQQKIQKREIDVAFRRQDIQRLPDRRGLEDSGIRMRYPDCISECFAKQRMIIDNEQSNHESLTRSIGCIQFMMPATSCPAVLVRTVGRFLHGLQIYKDISKLIVAE